jgi:hypothetical protein
MQGFYRLESPVPVEMGFAALAPPATPGPVAEVDPRAAAIGFRFRNASAATYRHPDPIAPMALVVRWRDAGGALVAESQATALLPIALASGDEVERAIAVGLPPGAGEYDVTVAVAREPDRVLSSRRVRVGAAATVP